MLIKKNLNPKLQADIIQTNLFTSHLACLIAPRYPQQIIRSHSKTSTISASASVLQLFMGKTAKCCKREVAVQRLNPHYERAALWEDRGNKVDKLIYINDPGGAWRFSNKELSHFLT